MQQQHLNLYIISIYIENVVRRFYMFFYCDCQKFNLTSGFVIFLFMVTGSRIIFICSIGVPNQNHFAEIVCNAF